MIYVTDIYKFSEANLTERCVYLRVVCKQRERGGESCETSNTCDNGQQGKTCEAVKAGKTFKKSFYDTIE